ncbi:MAG: hypothetical protein ACOY3P_02960 [Planctomycetota bacterium]
MTDFMANQDNDDGQLECPYCGGIFVHPVTVAVNPMGADGVECVVDAEGLRSRRAKPEGRGVTVWLHLDCEDCKAQFAQRTWFHKGHTHQQVVPVADSGATCETIWRD